MSKATDAEVERLAKLLWAANEAAWRRQVHTHNSFLWETALITEQWRFRAIARAVLRKYAPKSRRTKRGSK